MTTPGRGIQDAGEGSPAPLIPENGGEKDSVEGAGNHPTHLGGLFLPLSTSRSVLLTSTPHRAAPHTSPTQTCRDRTAAVTVRRPTAVHVCTRPATSTMCTLFCHSYCPHWCHNIHILCSSNILARYTAVSVHDRTPVNS